MIKPKNLNSKINNSLPIMTTMQHVSVESLEDLPSRITYLSSFLDLNPSDTEALLASKPLVAPLVPSILDAVYSKLLSFDITAQVFVPKNTGFEGEAVKDVHELTLESPQIAFRKDFLKVGYYLIFMIFIFIRGPRDGIKLMIFMIELPRKACVND